MSYARMALDVACSNSAVCFSGLTMQMPPGPAGPGPDKPGPGPGPGPDKPAGPGGPRPRKLNGSYRIPPALKSSIYIIIICSQNSIIILVDCKWIRNLHLYINACSTPCERELHNVLYESKNEVSAHQLCSRWLL